MTHLSARLAWHDRGWDGRVCDFPSLNGSCIVHEHIRDARDNAREDRAAGVLIGNLTEWSPPCSRDPGAYAPTGYRIVHNDPLEFRRLPSTEEELPPYSMCPAPYRWMREDAFEELRERHSLNIAPAPTGKTSGWVFEPERQRALLDHFWNAITPKQSLIFYYCTRGNPVDEETARLVVGVGRIGSVAEQRYFGTTAQYPDRYPIWSRRVTQLYPVEGVRLPYQEYLRGGRDAGGIAVRVPPSNLLEFSYGCEHVRDDTAVGILERVIQAVERVRNDAQVEGEWSRHLEWLHNALAEVWVARGTTPGVGSVLQWLGMQRGVAFHRSLIAAENHAYTAWQTVERMLRDREDPTNPVYRTEFARASTKWHGISPERRQLLSLLARMELDVDQVRRLADEDERAAHGIPATTAELLENPYVISEQDTGSDESSVIGLDVVDRAIRPDATFVETESSLIAPDDRRRVRAVLAEQLTEAASNGDSILPLRELIDQVRSRFPDRRACLPDRDVVMADEEFHRAVLNIEFSADRPTATLGSIARAEQLIREFVQRRVKRGPDKNAPAVPWESLVDAWLKEGSVLALDDAVESRARSEKLIALESLYRQRFSILTGRAGTGKTSVLQVLLSGLDQVEGRRPILLLAPTGKARVRLTSRTKRDASTIHQLLVRNGWLNLKTFRFKEEGGTPVQAHTVVVDEASMIPLDLLSALFRALDLNTVRRLILVGDPNQLPPIGPGRPFMDTLAWLEGDPERRGCVARLLERARHEDADSRALKLADGFLRDAPPAGDDELLSDVARGVSSGDLEVHFWKDRAELDAKLRSRLRELIPLASDTDYKGFNKSLGIADKLWDRAEAWQILTPLRAGGAGTSDLNREIQQTFRRGLIETAKRKKPRPFGDEQIVFTDKVIQIVNKRKKVAEGDGLGYVANGEIGIVKNTSHWDSGDSLEVIFSTQPKASYRYGRAQVDESLELAYALTVHKAQGSDFETVYFVLPEKAATLCRELVYTGLTRFRKRLVLLVQGDTAVLERMRRPEHSQTLMRNSHLFELCVRPEDISVPFAHRLIHRTSNGTLVRSKSEVIIADVLSRLGISYEYEKRLESKSDPKDFRLPDFTLHYEGDTFYWEHLGMLDVRSYRESWERKSAWYGANGYTTALITSEDGPERGIDVPAIEALARAKIIGM